MTNSKDAGQLTRLADAARSGGITKREFIRYSVLAGITASTATGLWSTQGGTFRWGVHDGNTSDSHDPGTYLTRQMIYLAHQYRSFLTMINPDNSLGPDLATGWSASPDATVWTFELNPDATSTAARK
jgi:peptide/nickel transport system substrate-binding protein